MLKDKYKTNQYKQQNEKHNLMSNRFALFVLVLLPFLSLTPKAEARLCWDLDGTGCQLQDSDIWADYYYPVSDHELNKSKANNGGTGHKFRIRPGCEDDDDSQGCDENQDFSVVLKSYQYDGTLPYTPSLGEKNKEDIELHIHGGDLKGDQHDWLVGESLQGELTKDKGLYTKEAYLKLEFSNSFVDNLSTGMHRFIFDIEGDSGDGKKQTLRYVFYLRVENQVQITSLEDAPLGNFPNHSEFFQQNFCVHATGDGSGQGAQFGMYATSENAQFFSFYLENKNLADAPEVPYVAKIGVGADAAPGTLLELNGQVAGLEFTGSPSTNCGGAENMTLRIELDVSFQALSQAPAGTYSDVLTLVVEAL